MSKKYRLVPFVLLVLFARPVGAADDPDGILKRYLEGEAQNGKRANQYTHVEEAGFFSFDKNGQPKKDQSETHEIVGSNDDLLTLFDNRVVDEEQIRGRKAWSLSALRILELGKDSDGGDRSFLHDDAPTVFRDSACDRVDVIHGDGAFEAIRAARAARLLTLVQQALHTRLLLVDCVYEIEIRARCRLSEPERFHRRLPRSLPYHP